MKVQENDVPIPQKYKNYPYICFPFRSCCDTYLKLQGWRNERAVVTSSNGDRILLVIDEDSSAQKNKVYLDVTHSSP